MLIIEKFPALLLLLIYLTRIVDSKCIKSHAVYCDDLSDLDAEDPRNVSLWTDLVIGYGNTNGSKMYTFAAQTVPLHRLEKLISLTFVNKLGDIDSYAFTADHDRYKIEVLTFYGGTIRRLKDTSFDSYTLRKLKISNTDLEYIHQGVFYNMHVKTMDFSENKLEAIESGVFTDFHGSNETIELILRNNNIGPIAQDSFPDGLEILNLDNNKIRVLNARTFINLVNLKELTLRNNQFVSVPYFQHMTKLRTLDLSHNKIISISMDYINPLVELQLLDLGFNQISHPNFFDGFAIPDKYPNLQISLVYNKLTNLFLNNTLLQSNIILFYGNPWHCKCWMMMEQCLSAKNFPRNDCDAKYFSNGRTPFCLQYSENVTCLETSFKGPAINDADYKQFISIVNNKNLFRCDLTIRPL